MGEGEKFIRQILPGLIFLIFSGIQIYSFMPAESYSFLAGLDTSAAIIGVIALGGVGYIFSNIYFVLTYLMGYTVSHVEFVQRLVRDKTIQLFRNGVSVDSNGIITQEESWSIINTIWYVTLKKDEMDRVTVPISRLSHLLHGIGISFIALIFSIIFSFVIFQIYGCDCSIFQYSIATTGTIFFLALIGYNYYITKLKYYSFVNSSVETAINEFKKQAETEFKPKEVIVHYSK